MKYHPCEQVEVVSTVHGTRIHMRDRLEAISHCVGRTYYYPTSSSITRLLKVMNEKMDLEAKRSTNGVISIIGWRK